MVPALAERSGLGALGSSLPEGPPQQDALEGVEVGRFIAKLGEQASAVLVHKLFVPIVSQDRPESRERRALDPFDYFSGRGQLVAVNLQPHVLPSETKGMEDLRILFRP